MNTEKRIRDAVRHKGVIGFAHAWWITADTIGGNYYITKRRSIARLWHTYGTSHKHKSRLICQVDTANSPADAYADLAEAYEHDADINCKECGGKKEIALWIDHRDGEVKIAPCPKCNDKDT